MPSLKRTSAHSLAIGTFATAIALLPSLAAAYDDLYIAVCHPRLTPIDTPLRPYFIPRRPAWGGNEYRYSLRPPEPFCPCDAGPNCGEDGDGACENDCCDRTCVPGWRSIPPCAAEAFEPWEFEHLGQIPHDSILGAAVATPAR